MEERCLTDMLLSKKIREAEIDDKDFHYKLVPRAKCYGCKDPYNKYCKERVVLE